MGKHQQPSEDFDKDGEVPDDVDLAALLEEPKGEHAVDDDEDD